MGYRGLAGDLLSRHGVKEGDRILLQTASYTHEGVIMPRFEYADDKHIVLKLKSGYNIGVRATKVLGITKMGSEHQPGFERPPLPPVNPNLPRVVILGTGGTIASRIDYRTGAVHAAFTPEELYSIVPELSDYANIETELLFNMYSENLTAAHWSIIARKVEEKVRSGARAVIIAHGTDTMGYTAAALSFALLGVPVPVLLVGAQRSTDRPSSDAASNLIGAVNAAVNAKFSGVFVIMHAGLDDDVIAVHRGTKVRKNHTSRRDAFESVNAPPVAYVQRGVLRVLEERLPSRADGSGFSAKPVFEEKVALLKFHPGFDPSFLTFCVEQRYRGIVLEGTGLGHVSSKCFDSVRRAREQGILVAMTSQCLFGRLGMTVYDTGRDILSLGVMPLGDMLPETALVKMMWVFGQTSDVERAKQLMMTNMAGELRERSSMDRRYEVGDLQPA